MVVPWTSAVVAVILLAGPARAATDGDGAARELFDRYFDWRMQDNPEFATVVGNHSYDDRLTSASMSAHRSRLTQMQSYLTEVSKLLKDDLSYHTRVSATVLRDNLVAFVDGETYKGYLFPSTYLYSVGKALSKVIKHMPFKNEQDYRNLLKRYGAFPRKVEEVIMLLRMGIEEGMVLHNVSMETLPAQLRHRTSPLTTPATSRRS
ncbi:uncharacterized protein LOC119109700 [Pollicipes pollicipes]|uniref:uncharacterized protein LOC119109700 n=1 Tax=Pollicipes pollicipes TaxID=41117 RepID=UPI00188523FE|nr:uncharacterized protein LOC119109700 [Pollicipes pollicipes]